MSTKSQWNRGKKDCVLIDDDPVFCNVFVEMAKGAGLEVDYYTSLLEMGSVGNLGNYKVAVVDYNLGQINGIEVAEYLPIFFGDMPMVLISSMDVPGMNLKQWPSSIWSFVQKSWGPALIIDKVKSILDEPESARSSNLLPTEDHLWGFL